MGGDVDVLSWSALEPTHRVLYQEMMRSDLSVIRQDLQFHCWLL